MEEEFMELELVDEPKEEEKKEDKAAPIEGVIPAGGGLSVTLKNPTIHIEKLIIRKKE
jgi:CO dehydrogenase/acetyl-CoA synthase beta subunit